MTEREMETLITGYKRDFFSKTGKGLKIKIATRWQSLCELPVGITTEELLDLIFECTGWDKKILKSKTRDRTSSEQRFMIMFILYLNGHKIVPISKLLDKDHTTVLYGIRTIEDRLDNEPLLTSYLVEIIDYIKEAKLLEKEGILE